MASLHVLIIDNSVPHRRIMMRAMQEALEHLPGGGHAEIAANPSEVSEKLSSFQPHAIFLNFAMSIVRVDGMRFLPWLRRKTSAHIVAYGLSEVLRSAALSSGAEAYFLRPTTEADWPPFCSMIARFLYRLAFLPEETVAVARPSAAQPAAGAAPPRRLPWLSRAKATVFTANTTAAETAPEAILPSAPLSVTPKQAQAIQKTAESILTQPKPQAPSFLPKPPALREIYADHQKKALTYAEKRFAALTRQAIAQPAAVPKAPPAHVDLPEISKMAQLDLIAIGASTGGTDAIAEVLHHLTPPLPPIVIVQHIPAYFSRLFAIRLNEECDIDVKEAADGDPVYPGHAYVAPGGLHMTVAREGARLVVHCAAGPKVHSVCPSVDVLFESVVKTIGHRALGIILTGMGRDGASGLLHMRQSGAVTLGQDEKSCVVYGMPRAAYDCGAVSHQLPLQHIAPAILKMAGR